MTECRAIINTPFQPDQIPKWSKISDLRFGLLYFLKLASKVLEHNVADKPRYNPRRPCSRTICRRHSPMPSLPGAHWMRTFIVSEIPCKTSTSKEPQRQTSYLKQCNNICFHKYYKRDSPNGWPAITPAMPPTPPAMNWSMFEPIWSLYYVCQKPNSHHNLFSSLGGVGENGHVIGEWSHLHFTSQIFCQICYPTWTWWLKTVFCKRYKLGGLAAVCYATPCTFFIFGHSNFNWYFPQNMSPKTRFKLGTRWKTWPDKRRWIIIVWRKVSI